MIVEKTGIVDYLMNVLVNALSTTSATGTHDDNNNDNETKLEKDMGQFKGLLILMSTVTMRRMRGSLQIGIPNLN